MDGTLLLSLGTDSIRGTLFSSDSLRVGVVEKPVDLLINEEYAEQDPEQWLDRIKEIIDEFQAKDEGVTISSITVTYQPGTFVCVDRSGNHIVNAILPCDKRARYQAHICYKTYKKQSQGLCIPWDNMILPRLLWFKYNQPDIFKKVFKVLTPDGYIAYRLCGETGIDIYSAAFLGYNPKNSQYNNTIINNMGLDIETFPRVYKSGECIGVVSGHEKERLNLSTEVKFILSSNSIIPLSCVCGNQEEKKIIYDAESSSVCFISKHIRFKKYSGLLSFPLKDDKYMYCLLGSYETKFLKWINKIMGSQIESSTDYSVGSNGIIIIPYIMGECTFYNSDMRGSIIGIENSSRSDIITACYEAIGYSLKEKLDYINEIGFNADSVEVFGNIKDKLFYRILSDAVSKKVIANSVDEIERYVYYYTIGRNEIEIENKEQLVPNESLSGKYQHLYSFYKSAYNSMSDVFKNRHRALKKIKE